MAEPADEPTLLDLAFAPPEAEERARRRFYALLLETPLFLPVRETAEDAAIAPVIFELSDGPVALAFDRDARLAEFFGAPTPFATLDGRALVAALAGRGLGLGLNLGAAPSATLLGAEAVDWLAANAAARLAAEAAGSGLVVRPPAGAPEAVALALAAGAAELPGLVSELWLVRLARAEGEPGRLTAVVRLAPAARRAGEGVALRLAAFAAPFAAEEDALDVAPAEEGGALLAAARTQGVALHRRPPQGEARPPDPSRPPRLR